MRSWHGHIANVGTVVLSSVVPPVLNNVYIEALHSPASGGAFGDIDSVDSILDASTGLAV